MFPPVRFPRSLAFLPLLAALPALAAEPRISFNRDIRPIFSDTCFQCHGPDKEKQKAGLRLDTRESALAAADSGEWAIVPGKPDESEVLRRLTSHDRDEVMPPPRLHKVITPEQVETVRRWIAQGAEYEGHWAFLPPQRVSPGAVPVPAGVAPAVNEIDHFVRARLTQANLTPRPEASRETLLRRVTLDLTGLPPTPDETRAFVEDPAADAYEKVVDRLLASPRYGERMAVQWLDFARYADSNGFQSDSSRQMWPWRDWVIEAFNRNVPFDQFTVEQIAGDLLPHPTTQQVVATGFNRNARLNGEGGRIVEEWFAETVIDRVETVGLTWLGLTFNCCRCHDHKYDPISQREFYQMFAFFNSVEETGVLDLPLGARTGGNTPPLLRLPTPEQEAQKAVLEGAVTVAERSAAVARRGLAEHQREWEGTFRETLASTAEAWRTLTPATVKSAGGATLTRQDDESWLASGPAPTKDVYTIVAPLTAGEFTGLRIEALPDGSLPTQSLGRASNGNFVLTGIEAEIAGPDETTPVKVMFARAEEDFAQEGYSAASVIGKAAKGRKQGWAVAGNVAANRVARKAMFVTATPVAVPDGAMLTVRLKQESQFARHNLGRFRLASTSLPPAVVGLQGGAVPESVRAALATVEGERTEAQRQALAKFYLENTDNPVSRATAELAAAKKELEQFVVSLPSTMVMQERGEPREAFVLKRGEYDKPGERVTRGVPAALPPMPAGEPVNRLGLARWLVAKENPLTARVWVNRAWEKFFGIGLVRTTENLGSQAEWPVNPELLDWLATEFVRLEWDMKAMQKTLVMSATYRQSSRVTPEGLARDPENRLLARGPRFRLSAEVIRDQALAVGGLLVEKLGGPSVRPYMPEGIWDETSKYGDLRGYKAGTGADLYRRSLYTIWKRTASPPTMTMFDSPTREMCTVKRSTTNTPLQALSLLNEVTFVEAARALAQRMVTEGGGTDAERIAWGFQQATGRTPTLREREVLQSGLEKRRARFQAEPAAAKQLLAVGAAKTAESVPPEELAAYAVTANVILNLDEVVTRE